MAFTRARLAGLWIFGSVIDPGEIEHIDDYYYAIDSRGGTYAPAGIITIGGLGLTLTGTGHHLGGTLTVDSLAQITIATGGTIKAEGTGTADIALKVVAGVALLDVESGAAARIKSGAGLDVFGSLTLKNASGPGSLTAESGTTIALNDVHVSGGEFAYPVALSSAQTEYRVFGASWLFIAGEWDEDGADEYIETTGNTGAVARCAVTVPPGTLNAVTVTIEGDPFYSAIPSGVPILTVYKQNLLTGAITVLDTEADSSPNYTAYQAPHQITVSGLGAVIDPQVETVWVKIAGESGLNSQEGMRLYRSVRTAVEISAIHGH